MAEPRTTDFTRWAESMVEPLRTRALEAEQRRELHAETVEEAADAGFFRALMPTELGGAGAGIVAVNEATRTLAHGDVSSAWTLSFITLHNWFIARGSQELQAAVFGDRGEARIPCPLAPGGSARPVDGGFVVNGRWEWATGVQHADWVMVHALVEQPGPLQTRFVLARIGDVAVDEVWHTSGMRATGSNTVEFDEVFVPTACTFTGDEFRSTDPAGAAHSDDPFLRYPVTPVLCLTAAAPALGGAEAAVELLRRQQESRVLAYSMGQKQVDQPAAQMRLAAALANVRAARLVWRDALDQLVAAADRGEVDDPAWRGSIRLAAAQTVRLSIQTVEIVLEGAGASVHFEDSQLQRIARDLQTLRGHVVFDWDRTTQLAGKLELGFEPGPADML